MPQTLQFRKLKVFSEEITESFPQESIHKSLISLIQGTEKKSEEYTELLFEAIELNYLRINLEEIEQIIPNFDKNLKFSIFDPKKTIFFMIDQEIWNAICQVVTAQLKECLAKSNDKNDSLKKSVEISEDYKILSGFFDKKMLFINIF
jgi:hypothetical protein